MSRTIRKQSGPRWWRDKNRSTYNFTRIEYRLVGEFGNYEMFRSYTARAETYEEIAAEMRKNIIKNELKNGYNSTGMNQAVKWHSNMMVRTSNRRELHKVLRDPENYEYNRDHDLRKRGIWWIYD